MKTPKMKTPKRGGRPTKTTTEGKNYRVNIKMSTSEYYILKARVKESGVSLSEYSREILSKGFIKQRMPLEILDLIRKLCGMANNLNQIAHKANLSGYNSTKNEYLFLAEKIDKLLKSIRL